LCSTGGRILPEADLTEAKNANMDREQIRNTVNEFMFAVRTLLSSIDPTRLRPH
jgi:hypothetical protein